MSETPALTPEQARELEAELTRRFERLRAEVNAEQAESDAARRRHETNEVRDSTDVSIAGAERDVSAAMLDLHEVELREVRAALARVDAGEYGVCVDCGAEIGYARLAAYPTARRCLACQSRRERAD